MGDPPAHRRMRDSTFGTSGQCLRTRSRSVVRLLLLPLLLLPCAGGGHAVAVADGSCVLAWADADGRADVSHDRLAWCRLPAVLCADVSSAMAQSTCCGGVAPGLASSAVRTDVQFKRMPASSNGCTTLNAPSCKTIAGIALGGSRRWGGGGSTTSSGARPSALFIGVAGFRRVTSMLVQPMQAAPLPAASRTAAVLGPRALPSPAPAAQAACSQSAQRAPAWVAGAAPAAPLRCGRHLRALAASSSSQGSIVELVAGVLELQLDVPPGSPQFKTNVQYLSRLAGKLGPFVDIAALFKAPPDISRLQPVQAMPAPFHPVPPLPFPHWARACAGWLHREQGVGQGLAVKLALHIPLELSRNPLDCLAPNYQLFRRGQEVDTDGSRLAAAFALALYGMQAPLSRVAAPVGLLRPAGVAHPDRLRPATPPHGAGGWRRLSPAARMPSHERCWRSAVARRRCCRQQTLKQHCTFWPPSCHG